MKKLLLIFTLIAIGLVSHGQIKGYSVEAVDYIILNDDTVRLSSPADGEYIGRISGVWTNTTGGSGTASVDSFEFNPSTGYIRWFIGGSAADSTSIDDRYVETEDSTTVFVTPTQLANSLVDVQTVVYSVRLPYASTVAGRIALAVEGTDYPTGWVLTAGASPTDIDIEHNLSRYAANVTVFAETVFARQLLLGSAGFTGITCIDNDNVRVQSLATIAKPIVIYIILE